MHINHEFVQKAILAWKISVISYQGPCERKGVKIEVALNATIMLRFIRCKIDIHKSERCSTTIKDHLMTTFFKSLKKGFHPEGE